MKAWHAAAAVMLAIVAFTAARSQRHGVVLPAAAVPAAGTSAAAPAQQVIERAPELVVAFRLDPALTRSLYMGERWVSPPVFDFVQPGDSFTVRAKVQSLGRDGEPTDLSGDWTAGNPAMLEVDRGDGGVTLRVREPGESTLTVATGAGTKTLQVHATRTPDAMRVAFSQ